MICEKNLVRDSVFLLVLNFYSGPILYDCRCLDSVGLLTGSGTIRTNCYLKRTTHVNTYSKLKHIGQCIILDSGMRRVSLVRNRKRLSKCDNQVVDNSVKASLKLYNYLQKITYLPPPPKKKGKTKQNKSKKRNAWDR